MRLHVLPKSSTSTLASAAAPAAPLKQKQHNLTPQLNPNKRSRSSRGGTAAGLVLTPSPSPLSRVARLQTGWLWEFDSSETKPQQRRKKRPGSEDKDDSDMKM
jgi:hypothetical protein